MLAGPHVRQRGRFEAAPEVTARTPKQIDMLPTALYLLGYPLSREFDGRVLWEALEPGMEQQRPATYVDAYAFSPPSPRDESQDSKEITEKKLHALGYVQ